jgi:hypothetical protein
MMSGVRRFCLISRVTEAYSELKMVPLCWIEEAQTEAPKSLK